MGRYFLLLVFLISILYYSQDASAGYCDSRPNSMFGLCQECAPECDYRWSTTGVPCTLTCPAGTVLVDNPPPFACSIACVKLHCGSAGVEAGNTCIQDPSLDSSCVDTSSQPYGWADNTVPFSCDCYFTDTTTINRYDKKPDGTACTKVGVPSGSCENGKCKAIITPPTACPDGTPVGSCCTDPPATKCVSDAQGIRCISDPNCPTCMDDDGLNTAVVGTCKDNAGGLCDASTGGCKDSCASNGATYEYYCAGQPTAQSCMKQQVACSSSEFCWGGKCDSNPWNEDDGPSPASGCAYISTDFQYDDGSHPCVSGPGEGGCPKSYYDQQWTCCSTIGSYGCSDEDGRPACASYDPTKGETPCCTESGYYTCTEQEQCTPDGCENVCNLDDKTSELYCEKCDYCRDGVQNCGETEKDLCGEPCTMTVTSTFTATAAYGCGMGPDTCRANGGTYIRDTGCSYAYEGECYSCTFECSATDNNAFNPASCSDGVQNCGETCIDGSAKCNAGTKETDNPYQPTFDFIQPPEVVDTKMYVDADSFNCMDGIDNDKDCSPDCSDSDCGNALGCDCTGIAACADQTPPDTRITFDPQFPNAKGWYTTKVKATLTCEDPSPSSGCSSRYRINDGQWMDYYWPFVIDDDGAFTIEYYSEDGAGNVEYPPKSATIKVYISPPLSILSKSNRVIVPLGSSGQLIVNVKNLQSIDDRMDISFSGGPQKLINWMWFTGHKEDSNRRKVSVQLQAGEERAVAVDIFGGEVLSGGLINVTAESFDKGVSKSATSDIDIVHSEDGLTVRTPEFGWLGFIVIALLGALLVL